MSESEGSARPRQLTMAGWFVVAGSVLLLLTAFDSLTNINSVDTRDRVTDMLSSPTGEGLGLSVSEALRIMQIGLTVAAMCAAASAVLGVFVLQRHRGARVALSIVAVPLLVTAPLTGGLMGALIAASTLMLWRGQARDWFAGRPIRQPAAPPTPPVSADRTQAPVDDPGPAAQPRPDVSTQSPSGEPAATADFGRRPVGQDDQAPPQQWSEQGSQQWAPPDPSQAAWHPVPASGPMPRSVRVACLLTWVFSGVVAVVYAAMFVGLLVAQDEMVDFVLNSPEWERANLDSDLLVPVLWLGCLMFLGWSAGALVLAWFTWRRHDWARYLLAVSAGGALVAGLFAFPFGLPHQVACVVTIVGLFNAQARAWFAQPRRRYGPPPGGYSGPPQGPQDKPPVW
jgi:hypothetical protein